jgi:hypothetical protein
MDFLRQLEQSGFATWVREGGGLLSYPLILFCHTIGLGTLAGVSAFVDLRLLGFANRMPLAPLRGLFKLMWGAFALTAASGICLLIADAHTKLASPIFYVKMFFVALALINVSLIRRTVFAGDNIDQRPLPSSAKLLAITSLVFWVAATTAGRLMAYLGPVSGID